MAEQQPEIRRRRDRVRGLPMHARFAGTRDDGHSGGAGRPIVLVHGLVVSSSHLEPALSRLARDHPSYAPDLPGYGLSAKPAEHFGLERQADHLGAWMDLLGVRPAALVGCSLGSQIVSHLALLRPELVNCAVLVSPTMDPAARGQLASLWRWAKELPHELTMLPLMLRDYARAGIPRALKTFEMARADRPEERLPGMAMPTLVVRGERDPIVPQLWAEQVARLLPNGRLRVVDGQAHAFNFTAPAEFARIVHEFVAEQAARDRAAA